MENVLDFITIDYIGTKFPVALYYIKAHFVVDVIVQRFIFTLSMTGDFITRSNNQ